MFTETTKRLGIQGNKNHRYVSCHENHIVFSYTQQGKAMTCHIASDKTGLRHIKQSINAFCDWLFINYANINIVLAVINKSSIERVVKKCNFSFAGDLKGYKIYKRVL